MNTSTPWQTPAIILVVLSFFASVLMFLVGEDVFQPRSFGADAFSRSAIGHRAFVQLLRDQGTEIRVGRSPDQLASSAMEGAWIAEPRMAAPGETLGRPLIERFDSVAGRTALVLPERVGLEHRQRPGWIAHFRRTSLYRLDEFLETLGLEARVVRPDVVTGPWQSRWGDLDLELHQPQLMQGAELEPVVWCEDGILVAIQEIGPHRILLIADPELVANDGLARADHAALALQLASWTAPREGPLLIDASLQGFVHAGSVWAELGRYPLALVTFQGVLLLLLFVWRGALRFGRPTLDRARSGAGKHELIENTTRLMIAAGHGAVLVQRYADHLVQSTAGALHAPRSKDSSTLAEWLARIERDRSSHRARELLERAHSLSSSKPTSHTDLVACARDLADWRREMLGESGTTPVARG